MRSTNRVVGEKVGEANKGKIAQALKEFEKHPFGDLIISKHRGVIKSFRVNTEVRFKDSGTDTVDT